ncbi:MAG: lyase domain protein repeat-containing protein, partial [Gammaproteobacteria bacterium]|nr:lyase domain protein repeat-containing protein [Gammaproteobacteria bacterium]
VKCVAASALGNLNNPSEAIIKGLQNAFESENKRVKIAAAEALNRLKHSSETIITELLNALQNGNWYARSDAASALSKLEDPSEALIKGLLNILRDEDKDVRDAVSTAFEEAFVKLNSPSEAIITELFSVLRDKELIVNEAPALALSKLKNPSAVVIKILINALRDENERVRKASAVALGNLNSSDEAVIEALINALWDKDWSVRDVVAEALGKLNNPSEVVIEVLISASWKTSSAAEALSTPKAIHATTLIFKQLIRDEQGSIEYFSCWFEKNYLLVMDSKKGNVIARQGRQNYSIPLSPNDLAHLEKQVTAVAKHKNYPSEFYNLSGGSSSHVEKAILQDCQPNTSVCFVSNAMWLVHLVRKKAGERTLLIVEGLVAGKHIAQCYEFALSQRNSNPSSGFFLPGGGVGDVLKTRNFLDLLEKHKKDYQYKSWDIDSTIGQILLRSVEIEALSSEMQRHDCLAWAEEKLTAIGLPIEGCWTSFTVVLPAVVPEKAKKPASVPVVEENRFCRLM